MKKLFLSILTAALLTMSTPAFAAGGVTVSTGSLSMQVGESRSFTITASNAACRVDISSTNAGVATVSKASDFIDMSNTSISVSGKSAGSATIQIRTNGELCATYDGEPIEKTMTISVSVAAVPAPAPTPEPTPAPAPTPTNNQPKNNQSTPAKKEETPMPSVAEESPMEDPEEIIVETDPEPQEEVELENVEPLGELAKVTDLYCVSGLILFTPYVVSGILIIAAIVLLITKIIKRQRLQKINTSTTISYEEKYHQNNFINKDENGSNYSNNANSNTDSGTNASSDTGA